MKNIVYKTALCGIMLLNTSSASSPEVSPMGAMAPQPYMLVKFDPVNSYNWLCEEIIAMHPPVVWPTPVIIHKPKAPAQPKPARISAPVSVSKDASFEAHYSKVTHGKSYSELYELAISFIKYHEGFAGGRAYYCAAGYKTIGYGHVVKPTELFPEVISMEYADKLLRKDFDKSIKAALMLSPHLSGGQLLAVAHFCFAKGPGHYEGSTLRKVINSGGHPDAEFRKWCKFKNTSGVMVKSPYSQKIREWEILMYHSGDIPEPQISADTTAFNNISEI